MLHASRSTKFDLRWGARRLREVWTKSFKFALEPALSDNDLRKKTVNTTLESTCGSTLKAGMKTKLPTCEDKGVFRGDDGTYINRT